MCNALFHNETSTIGPHPGRTWEDEASEVDAIFGFEVTPKIKDNQCDYCARECDPKWVFCSRACCIKYEAEAEDEAAWEAMVS